MNEEKLMKYFLEAKDLGVIDEPTTVGIGGDPGCTDYIKIYLKISQNDIIEDAKAQVFGCHVAVACTSAYLQLIKNKNIRDAVNIKSKDVVKEVGGLSDKKTHCSELGPLALENAISDYLINKLYATQEDS